MVSMPQAYLSALVSGVASISAPFAMSPPTLMRTFGVVAVITPASSHPIPEVFFFYDDGAAF